jgi:uncharacterized protein (TIRG00374 family)
MRFRRVTVVALVALMGYTAVAFWVGMPQVIEAAGKIDAWAYVFLLGLTLTNHVIRFLRSRWLLSCLNHDLPVLRYMTYYLFGIAFLATPARVGEAIRTFFLRKDGVPYTDSLSILLLERVYDVLAMACLSLLAVAYVDTIAVIATVLLILSFLLLSTRMDKMLNLLVHVGTRLASSWGRWGFQKIGGLQPTMSILLESPRPMLSLGSGLLGFAVQSAGFYFIVSGLGVDAPFWASIGIYALSVTLGSFSTMPGGLGTTEATMALLLTLIGVTAADTVTVIVISRLTTLWFSVAFGMVVFGLIRPTMAVSS